MKYSIKRLFERFIREADLQWDFDDGPSGPAAGSVDPWSKRDKNVPTRTNKPKPKPPVYDKACDYFDEAIKDGNWQPVMKKSVQVAIDKFKGKEQLSPDEQKDLSILLYHGADGHVGDYTEKEVFEMAEELGMGWW